MSAALKAVGRSAGNVGIGVILAAAALDLGWGVGGAITEILSGSFALVPVFVTWERRGR